VERCGGSAHQRRTLLEGNFFRKQNGVALRDDDVFGITAVRIVTKHEAVRAKLLISRAAMVAVATRDVIVQTDTIANLVLCYTASRLFNDASNLMAQGHRQGSHRSGAGPIVSIGVANTGRANSYENIVISGGWSGNLPHLQRLSHFNKADGFHSAISRPHLKNLSREERILRSNVTPQRDKCFK
jgi:hypothetical protein